MHARRLPHATPPVRTLVATAALTLVCGAFAQTVATPPGLTTKTPYTPRQDAGTYEPAPAGFATVYTELVARHGTRGLSSPGPEVAAYNMWLRASAEGGLTKLGQRLGPDILRIIQANALLGYGVPGISAPGYGNLTQTGIGEHTQLAVRMNQRLGSFYADVAAQPRASQRQVVVSTSGVNRAVDSAYFFTTSLGQQVPGVAAAIVNSAALTAYPVNKPATQAAGVDRFTLYFHKLSAKVDLPATTDIRYPIYQASLAYQSYLASNADLAAKIGSVLSDPNAKAQARTALSAIFTSAFLAKIDNGNYSFASTGSWSFTSADGKYTTTVNGDGSSTIASLLDAATAIYSVYAVAPGMVNEAPLNMEKYLPAAQAQALAYLQDTQDFYQKGPGIAEANPVTYGMAQGLLDDFFKEVNAIAAGDLSHAAKLRFTHAEIIMPFASLLGLANVYVPVPKAATYTYGGNPWRGENVSPMAANFQWDVLRNSSGTLLVKMLYNEKETDFKPACESARYFAGSTSHYYDYSKLKACYGY